MTAPPEQLLCAVVSLSDDAILTVGTDGRIEYSSSVAERIFGVSTEELVGCPAESLFSEHVRPLVRLLIRRSLAGEPVRHVEAEALRPDGMPVPVWLSLAPLGDSEVEPAASVLVIKDVTEQKLAQAVLAESESRLEEAEALAHVGSWLWDVRTGAVQWSAEFHRLHGVGPAGFGGTFESHISFVHPEDRDRLSGAMHSSVDLRERLEAEYRVVSPDGTIRQLVVRAQPTIGSSGKAVGLRGVGKIAGR